MQPKQPFPTPDEKASSVPSPDLTKLLNAGMGVVYVDDDADFPESSLLIVKKSFAPALTRLVTEVIGQVECPFAVISILLLCFSFTLW